MPRKHKQIGMSEPPATEVPPLQNLNLNPKLNPTEHLPAELLLMIRDKLLDSKLPGQVCAEWNAWCRFGKSTHTMCSNPDDLAWEEGCKLLGLNNKPTQNPERTWRAIFNGLCNDLFHLKDARRDISVPSNERPWVWYMWLLKERAASGTPQARGAVWLRRCAAEVLRRTPPSAEGHAAPCGMKPGAMAMLAMAALYSSALECSTCSIPRASAARKLPTGDLRSHVGIGRV